MSEILMTKIYYFGIKGVVFKLLKVTQIFFKNKQNTNI